MLDLAPELPADAAAVESLLDAAFGPDRRSKRSYGYRDGVPPVAELCFVVREAAPRSVASAGRIVGSIRYWPVSLGGVATLLLGPLAVDPRRQGTGIGATLVYHTIDRAAREGWPFVLLVGEPTYYRRFGFRAAPRGVAMPGEQAHRLLVRPLRVGALEGIGGAVEPWRPAGPSGAGLPSGTGHVAWQRSCAG